MDIIYSMTVNLLDRHEGYQFSQSVCVAPQSLKIIVMDFALPERHDDITDYITCV